MTKVLVLNTDGSFGEVDSSTFVTDSNDTVHFDGGGASKAPGTISYDMGNASTT